MKRQASSAAGSPIDASPEKNHVGNRLSAFVLADSHQDYVVHSTLRNVLRGLIVFAVFAATIAFIAVKYATEDELRNSTVTVREENYKGLSQTQIDVAICPCRNETFFYSEFAFYRAPLSQNYSMQVQVCQDAIVPGYSKMPRPGNNSTPDEVNTYLGYLNTLQANTLTLISCSLSVTDILRALDPDPAVHLIGVGDNWYNTDLLSEQQVLSRIRAFLGQKVLDSSFSFASQMTVQRLVLDSFKTNLTNVVADLEALNDTATTAAAQVSQLSFDLYANVTADALTALLDTSSDTNGYVKRLTNTLRNAVYIDYDKYAAACGPQYCDYTQKKSVWARLTEFLGLLGGLYTTFLGIGLTAWFLVDLVLPAGHGRIMI